MKKLNIELRASKLLSPEEAFNMLMIDENENWIKYYRQESKQNLYLQFKDGYVFEVSREVIQKDMYYDDETEAPKENWNNFKYYNFRFRNWDHLNKWREEEEKLKKDGYCSGNHGRMWLTSRYHNKKIVGVGTVAFTVDGLKPEEYERSNFIRYLTDDEQDDVLALANLADELFEKRLKTYWKKYSDKVIARGYWANR